MQFHDQPQHVTIGISSDDLLAAVRLQSARLRALECMPQIGKRDAALLHRGPGMIVNEDSATTRKGPDFALRFRSLHPQHDRSRLDILSSLGVLLRISWTRSRQTRWRLAVVGQNSICTLDVGRQGGWTAMHLVLALLGALRAALGARWSSVRCS